MVVPTAVRGLPRSIVADRRWSLRGAVAGALDPELFHPASERIGVQLEDCRRASGPSMTQPVCSTAARMCARSTSSRLARGRGAAGASAGPRRRTFPAPGAGCRQGASWERCSSVDVRREDDRALDDVLQLADVAGPGIGRQRVHRLVGDTGLTRLPSFRANCARKNITSSRMSSRRSRSGGTPRGKTLRR